MLCVLSSFLCSEGSKYEVPEKEKESAGNAGSRGLLPLVKYPDICLDRTRRG
jgi:hypothetical protein